jgi:hypothetical protein
MAVLARVQHILTGQTVVVGNCHLYWVSESDLYPRLHDEGTELTPCFVALAPSLRVFEGTELDRRSTSSPCHFGSMSLLLLSLTSLCTHC